MRKFIARLFNLAPVEDLNDARERQHRAEGMVDDMRTKSMTFDHRLVEVGLDSKDKTAVLVNELKMQRQGAPTACNCPAGKCMKMLRDSGQMCWGKWADAEARRLAAQREQDAMILAANHPKRLRIVSTDESLPPPG